MIKAGEMVELKEEDYKAPIPTGDRVGFRVEGVSGFPLGLVLDDTIPEGEAHVLTQGTFVIK